MVTVRFFGSQVSAHPGVGGGAHRRRATFDRCEVRGVILRVVVYGVVLVVCLCVWPVSYRHVLVPNVLRPGLQLTPVLSFQAHTHTWFTDGL